MTRCVCLTKRPPKRAGAPASWAWCTATPGGPDFARALLDRGLYLGFSGILTFRSADMLRGVARTVPADRLLIETDSPFLAPVPKRGQRNEPAFVVHVAELLATLRGVTLDELADQTNANAERLFGAWPA